MEISEYVKYVGVNDHQVDLFEGQYQVPHGMAYNSYIIIDEKIAVMDTVDGAFSGEFLQNIEQVLAGRKPDYLVIQHMEPDHSASIPAFLQRYPETVVVSTAMGFKYMEQFFPEIEIAAEKRIIAANSGTLELGSHTLHFVYAPMVHWPEVMMTYEASEKILFAADGFGKFGALDVEEDWVDEARRYYIGIVGKYGAQVQAVLKKASTLDIQTICSLHGPVLKDNLGFYLEKYDKWSSYQPEESGVVIAYASVYGNTKKAAQYLADKLSKSGQKTVLYDLARCDKAAAIADAFRYDKLVLAGITYNGDLFPCMRAYIEGLTERSYQNRRVAVIENGTWAPMAAKLIRGMFEKSKDIAFTDTNITIKSAMNAQNRAELDKLAAELG
ncbi:MAG: FprA family A-type flavoprotein [Lachnospiraceae bacterium]|nr:FprA family A-type flavoprotein [Lachnospiraceae bacterium]